MKTIKELIYEVLETGYLASIASVDASGPWVSDVIYISDSELNLYFISRKEFRHSIAYTKNPKAAGSVTSIEKPLGKSAGVQFEGIVECVDSIPEEALKQYSLKRGITDMWKLEEGEAWYKFSPTKFDLIYESIFGFTKKSLVIEK